MAAFCLQCAKTMDFPTDLDGIITAEQHADGFVARVLCEGCGYIAVDHEGRCLSADCLEGHAASARYEPPCSAALAVHKATARFFMHSVATQRAQRTLWEQIIVLMSGPKPPAPPPGWVSPVA